jgi:hypothetical protein
MPFRQIFFDLALICFFAPGWFRPAPVVFPAGAAAGRSAHSPSPSSDEPGSAAAAATTTTAAAVAAAFPFEADPDDHCESPLEAYQDIAHLLRKALELRRQQQHAPDRPGDAAEGGSGTVYDPYYCNGSVIENLKRLGFGSVYNRKEDCYAAWSSASLPEFGALVTNPPYSGDHMERLLEFVASPAFGDRPWFLLLPSWVVKKEYYERLVLAQSPRGGGGGGPFYLVPRTRYVYLPPAQFRSRKKSDTHKKSSPFASLWCVHGGTPGRTEALIREHRRHQLQQQRQRLASGDPPIPCDLARSKSALRDLRRKPR